MNIQHSDLTLTSCPENINKVVPFVDDLARQYNLSPDLRGNILLTLTEAVTNAMLHGNSGDANKCVLISLRVKQNNLAIRVSDEGRGFDPDSVPDPTTPDRIENCGGRGLFLMQQFSDECRFIRGGRTVEMRFHLDREQRKSR